MATRRCGLNVQRCSDEESSASLLASPRGGAAGRDLQTALAAVEANLQQLLLSSSGGMTLAANVCSQFFQQH